MAKPKKPAQKKSARKKPVPPQLRGWLETVKSVQKANPSLEYKEVLKKAKAKYAQLKKSVGL